MKNLLLVLIGVIGIYHLAESQIIYTSEDYAEVNDSFNISLAGPELTRLDFSLAGADVVWDYSELSFIDQRVISFIDPLAGGYQFAWCFSNSILFGCEARFRDFTNIARPLADNLNIAGLELQNVINHFEKDQNVYQYKLIAGQTTAGSGIALPLTGQFERAGYDLPIST